MNKTKNYSSWLYRRSILILIFTLVLVLTVSLLRTRNVVEGASLLYPNGNIAVNDPSSGAENVLNPLPDLADIPSEPKKEHQNLSLSAIVPELAKRPRKFFLDCGANTGSTYKLFHEIWPYPEDYYMISFEIDPNLAPYYAGFVNHTAMVPLGVSMEKGNFEAYLEPAWAPMNRGASKWGGGSLFTFTKEGKNEWRGLKRFVNVPTFDLSRFIQDNFHTSDEVVLKIDIEGAEYRVIDKMLKDGTFKLVDMFFLEFHDWQPTGWTKSQKDDLRRRMKSAGVRFKKWEAEYPVVPDAENWSPALIGELQKAQSKLCFPSQSGTIKLAVAVGMNKRKSSRLIQSVLAHNLTSKLNIAVFVYRDFIYEHPDVVLQWANNPRIILGLRGDSPRPIEYFKKLIYNNEIRMMIISTLRQLVRTTGRSTEWYLPDVDGNRYIESALQSLKLKFLDNNVWVPPQDPSTLGAPFFSKRTVEKIPPVLDATYNSLMVPQGAKKKWIVLNSDFDETWISSVFLLDYLASQHARESNLVVESFLTC